MKTGPDYSVLLTAAASLACVLGCFSADPRSVEGALDFAARALEAHDTQQLFRILDQQSRHALDATRKARQEAAAIIRASYPPEQVDAALRELGDGAVAKSTPELFEKRCDTECLQWFESRVGGVSEQRTEKGLVVVRTVRDTELKLRRGTDGWYGVVWQTEELSDERDRAVRDLAQIQDNARVYSSRRRLESKN